jgi:hypothetical protein
MISEPETLTDAVRRIYCQKHASGDVTDYRLAKMTGIAQSTLTTFRTSDNDMRARSLQSLAKALGLQITITAG